MTTSPVRRRRGYELRELVLEASRELFAREGYAGTRTRDVARRAGVTEHAIYRHFGSKAGLYEAGVMEPFSRFVDAYLEEVDRLRDDLSLEDVVERFVRGFFGLLRDHRDTLLTILSARTHADPSFRRIAADIEHRFTDGLEQTRALLERQKEEHGLSGVDTTTAWAAMVGMMLAMAVHDDLLYPTGQEPPSEEEQVREMVALILHGIAHRA